MGISTGFSRTITSGSIFAFDTSDVINSYKGEPTTNICTGVDYSIYNNGATNYRNQTFPLPVAPGYEVVKVVANTPGTYGQSILWRAPYATNVMTITNSVYAWLESGTYVQVGQHWYPWYYGTEKYIPTGQWVRISETYNINEGASYGSAAMVYSTNGVAYFCMPQYEIKPHITPFVGFDQTRSNTQALLPLVSNSSIDLSNVSFDANAQMYFDGTNDYVNLGSYLYNIDTSTLSIELVFKTNTLSGCLTLLGWHENEYPHGYICLGNFTGYWGNETISFYNEGPGTTPLSFAYTNGHDFLSDGLYHHVVFILKTNEYKIYVDGTEVAVNASFRNGTQSTVMPSNLFGYGATPSVILGAGSDPAGAFFNGVIPVTKIYNRALSAGEVKQNYNKYKSRFKLS